ncbi:hypothetical protein Hanom_Chr01g00043851 [Helianthus anomalus]
MEKGLKILLKKKPVQKPSKPPTPPPEPQHQSSSIQSPPHLSPPHLSPPHIHVATPPHEQQPIVTSQQIFQTPPSTQPPIQTTPGSSGYKTFPTVPEGITRDEIGDFGFANDEQVKRLEKKVEEVVVENKKLLDREKKLEKRVKIVQAENTSLLKKSEVDQSEIDILKVKVAELEEEKARHDEQNKYFELKNKELEAAKAMKEHEIYMMNKEDVLFEDVIKEEDEEEEDEEEVNVDEKKVGDADDVFSASSHSDNDDDDDDGQGGIGVKVSEASNEQNVDDFLHVDANEEAEDVSGEGEHVDDQNVDKDEKLILRLEPEVEEGEIKHTYTMAEIIELTRIDNPDFKFDFEEELNAFDINQQPDYEYKYVEEADKYDQVEIEDCIDEENVNVDTSDFPTLVEFFSQENADELRRKVVECLKDKNFDGTTKEPQREERKKWFRKSTERKFKRQLKYYKRDRDVSLGDIISWGFLPQVNVYAIRREFGVQYFEYIQDIMSLPWWDVEELSKVRTLNYPVRKHDVAIWGLMKFEAFRGFKHWKPHYLKKVRRVNPETGNVETILKIKKPKVLKNIPVLKMEQDLYTGFIYWVYSCLSTEVVITYRVENEVRYIHVFDPLWLVNCSAKDIECLFVNKIGFKVEDKDQAMQF